MMNPADVKKLLEPAFPGAEIWVDDMTGSRDHFQIQVVSSDFRGKLLIDQHRMVQKPLEAAFADGRIHAIAIKTFTPERWKKEQTGGLNVL